MTELESTGSLMRTPITTFVGTFTRPLAGFCAMTIGGAMSGPGATENCVAVAGAALPLMSVTPAIVMVTTWPSGSRVCGARNTSRFWLPRLTEYFTAASGPLTDTVVPLIVCGLIGSLNRMMMPALSPTLTALCGGVTDRTVGGVVSAGSPVEKYCQLELGWDRPAALRIPVKVSR